MEKSYKIVRLTTPYIEGALFTMRNSFFPSDTVCKALQIQKESKDEKYESSMAAAELERLAIDTIKDGVSIVAVDTQSNKVVSAAINKIQVPALPGELSYIQKFAQSFKEDSSRTFISFMNSIHGKLNLFEFLDTECIFEIMFIATLPSHSGHGIGQQLIENSIELAQAMRDEDIDQVKNTPEFNNSYVLNLRPECVTAIAFSKNTQKICERGGLKTFLEFPYTRLEHKGVKLNEIIGPDHPFCTLNVRILESRLTPDFC